MSRQEKKVKSLTWEVICNVSVMLVIVNLIVLGNIAFWVSYSIEKSEKQYMGEILTRLQGEVGYEVQRYMDAVQGLALNNVLIDYLETVDTVGVSAHEKDTSVRAELGIAATLYGDVLLHSVVGSVKSNNVIDHTVGSGGAGFNLSNQAYYAAVTEKRTVISDAYSDTTTGKTIVTIAHPVLSSNGSVLGLVAFDLLTEQLSGFITETSYGDSGTTFMFDRSFNVLVQPTGSGSSVGNTSYEGDDLQREMANPSGEIIKFTSGGVSRMGGFALVEQSDWILVTAVDVEDFQARSRLIVGALSIMQIICFFVGICACARFVHKKLEPIKTIQEFMHEISEGNLKANLEYESDDEMGALVKDIQNMVASLFVYIDHVSNTIHDFAEGRIQMSHDVDYVGDFKPIYDSMSDFVGLMSVSLSDLKRSVTEVGTGAHQISGGANILASGSEEQAASVQELNALISHVNEEITETAKYSGKIAGYADNITVNITLNNEKMKDLATNVQKIKDHSDEVKRIIKAIEEVAFQTNILALNAAVEAARAGETGKGFAVVADEVRNLSLKTSEAVQDTTKIITEMASFVELSTDLAHETSGDLQKIVEEAEHFVSNMTSITHSTNDQSKAISEILTGIEQISNVVHQNSAISEESAAATEELSAQASMMTELIEKFEV